MRQILSLFSLVLMLASTTIIADQKTVEALEAEGVTLGPEQTESIHTVNSDDADTFVKTIATLIIDNSSDRLQIKNIIQAAVSVRPDLIISITIYALAGTPANDNNDICTGALLGLQSNSTIQPNNLADQALECSTVYTMMNTTGYGDRALSSNNNEQAASPSGKVRP